MRMRFFFLLGFVMAIHIAAMAQNSSGPEISDVRTTIYPAVYKTEAAGQARCVWINMKSKGAATVMCTLGKTTQKVNLNDGDNRFSICIPEVKKATKLMLTVKNGDRVVAKSKVEVRPARHWQMNLVQHTHTDIGYTRSQMEILAEHLRYIDYALDYCDATDNYPDAAKFRWTCEVSWAVSEYLKTRPAEQVERLKRRVKDG